MISNVLIPHTLSGVKTLGSGRGHHSVVPSFSLLHLGMCSFITDQLVALSYLLIVIPVLCTRKLIEFPKTGHRRS